MSLNLRRPHIVLLWILGLSCIFGCGEDSVELVWEDLDAQEQTYVRRFVVLERARAVSFADLERGTALLDSLAIAWGDTLAPTPETGLPDDPHRLDELLRLTR